MTAARRETVLPPGKAPFVNRRSELALLAARFAEARSGEASAVLVVGEAGIGKSRLIREALSRAEDAGMQSCYGRFLEGPSEPLTPFESALLPQLRRAGLVPPEATLARLGNAAPGTSGGMPMLAELSRLTLELAKLRPLVLVFDDVQWATEAESTALEHLALAVSDAARRGAANICMLFGTRPTDHGMAADAMLARLRREPLTSSLDVRGFDELVTSEFLRECTQGRTSRQFAHSLQQATGGNPLFLGEALTWVAEHGLPAVDAGGAQEFSLRLPPEVAGAIEARVRQLQPELARLLSIAALAGDSFASALLAEIAERDEAIVIEQLDEAIHGGFVDESEGLYRFAHPVVRQVFANQGTSIRRKQTHASIAKCLSRPGAGRTAIEVAVHLLAAAEQADPLEAAHTAHAAARELAALNDWAEAGRYFEAALASDLYSATLAPAERCQLSHDAAFVHYRNMDVELSRRRFGEAIAQAKTLGDLELWSRSLVGWVRSQISHGGVSPGRALPREPLDEFLPASVGHEVARARVEAEWAEALWVAQDPAALELAEDALGVAREYGDDLLLTHAAVTKAMALMQVLRLDEALLALNESLDGARRLEDCWYEGYALQQLPSCLLMLGRLAEAERACAEAIEHGAVTHDWPVAAMGYGYRTVINVLKGDFTAAEADALDCRLMTVRSDYLWGALPMEAALAWGRSLRGDALGAADAVSMLEGDVGKFNAWALAKLSKKLVGDDAPDFDVAARAGGWRGPLSSFNAGFFAARVELGHLAAHPPLVDYVGDALAEGPSGLRFTPVPSMSMSRSVATVRLVRGEWEAASTELQLAAEEARACGARTEQALALGARAEALWALAHDTEAAAAVNEAHALALELGMFPVARRLRGVAESHDCRIAEPLASNLYPAGLNELEVDVLTELSRGFEPETIARNLLISERTAEARLASARAKTGVTSASAAAEFLRDTGLLLDRVPDAHSLAAGARAAGLQVLMFTDIVSSTPLNRLLGDERYLELLSMHDAATERTIVASGGRLIKNMGDGAFAAFPSARNALDAATAILAQFPMAHPKEPSAAIQIRAGLHAGEPLARSDDLFGLSVVIARRVCDRAPDGGLYVSQAVRDLAEGSDYRFEDRGRFALKGIGRRVRLLQVFPPDRA